MQLLRFANTLAIALATVSAAHGAAIVSNFPANNQAGAGYNVSANEHVAIVVTTQATALQFESLETVFNSYCTNRIDCPYTAQGGIYADGGTAPGALLAAFNSQDLGPGQNQLITFTTAAPFTLSGNTRYWFVLRGVNPVASSLEWIDGGEIYTDSIYASADGFSVSSNNGAIWTPVNENDHTQSDGNPQAQINASPVPEPSAFALFGAGLVILTRLRRAGN